MTRQLDTLTRQLAWAIAHGDHISVIWLGQRIRRALGVVRPAA